VTTEPPQRRPGGETSCADEGKLFPRDSQRARRCPTQIATLTIEFSSVVRTGYRIVIAVSNESLIPTYSAIVATAQATTTHMMLGSVAVLCMRRRKLQKESLSSDGDAKP
jgi:hypothetical protein